MREDKKFLYTMQKKNGQSSGKDCLGVPASEEFQEYLVDYLFEEELFEEEDVSYCVYPIGYNQSVVYVRTDEPLTGKSRNLRYNMIPKCYGLMGSEALEEIGVLKVRRSPQLGFRGSGTLVGVIDTGIDLKDPLFLYEDGTTKVASLWDQSDQTGPRPEGFLYGTQWDRAEIDAALKKEAGREGPGSLQGENPVNQADENPVNRGSENLNRLPGDEEGHGTFLAAAAAGREDADRGFSGTAPDAELVVVKLKQAKTYLRDFYSIPANVWACQEDDVMLAIRYIVETADRLDRPVSICLGIGTNLGGHNGTNGLERYISYLSLLPGISFHLAAGNEGIAGHHFKGRIRAGEAYESVAFHVAEGENGFVMELWGEEPNVYTVGVLSPGGENIDRIQLKMGEFRSIRFFPENTLLEIRSFPGATISGTQVIRMNFKEPVPGIWKLFVYGTGNSERSYDIWLPVSNFLKEETYFLNPDSEQTVTSPGNAQYAITWTPCDITTGGLYVRAGKGYTRDGRIVPDLAAPGVGISVPKAGGRTSVKSGSSIAAAFGAGIGALMQEWAFVKDYDPFMNGQNLRTYLIQGAKKPEPYEYPNREWGYGLADVYTTFLRMRG